MKIILSHDVDHLSLFEHWKDRYIPGLLLRSLKGMGQSGISFPVLLKRFTAQRLTRVNELHEFNLSAGASSTFFFGMRNGLQLSYHWKEAGKYITQLHAKKANIGLHGQSYDSLEGLKEERDRILSFLPDGYPLGIRNHYLRKNENTLRFMDELGLQFDSTHYNLDRPFKQGGLWEIPISYMDAGHISHGKNDKDLIRKKTLQLIDEAQKKELPFFVVNFHDTYFTPAFPFHYDWYRWLLNHLVSHNFKFADFNEAVTYLETNEAK